MPEIVQEVDSTQLIDTRKLRVGQCIYVRDKGIVLCKEEPGHIRVYTYEEYLRKVQSTQ